MTARRTRLSCRAVPGMPGAIARQVDRLPHSLPGGIPYSPIGELADGCLLLNAQGIGRFLVRDGHTVEYVVDAGADSVAVDRFLWGSARSALIHQRGELPLHASVVIEPGGKRAIALCGASGAGKSTTAAALLRSRWTSLADDLARIVRTDSAICVWPGPAWMRLSLDACQHLDVDPAGLARDLDDRNKVLLAVPASNRPMPLQAVVELGGERELPYLEPLTGGAAMAVLSRNTVGLRKMGALHSITEQFSIVSQIAAGIAVFRLHGRKTSSASVLAANLHEALTASTI